MTLHERLRQLATALPSDSAAVTLTRADLLSLVDGAEEPVGPSGDLTVDDVAKEARRAPSTVRGWLNSGELKGYKLNHRDWRITRHALRDYLHRQARTTVASDQDRGVDISAWRKAQGI